MCLACGTWKPGRLSSNLQLWEMLRNTPDAGSSLCKLQVRTQIEMQLEFWARAHWDKSCELLTLCTAKSTRVVALARRRDTGRQQEPRAQGEERDLGDLRLAHSLDCEGKKAQGFLCLGSSLEAAAGAVSVLLRREKMVLWNETSKALPWEVSSGCERGTHKRGCHGLSAAVTVSDPGAATARVSSMVTLGSFLNRTTPSVVKFLIACL